MDWVEPPFSRLTPQMFPLLNVVAFSISPTLTTHLEGVPLDRALVQLRANVTEIPSLTASRLPSRL